MSGLMPTWPAGFLPGPDRNGWEGEPFETRSVFDPEIGAPLTRPRVTAETWAFRGLFPSADVAEREAFEAFWHEIGRGAEAFLWRDPTDQVWRAWKFGASSPVRMVQVAAARWDFTLSVLRLPSTPWWAATPPV